MLSVSWLGYLPESNSEEGVKTGGEARRAPPVFTPSLCFLLNFILQIVPAAALCFGYFAVFFGAPLTASAGGAPPFFALVDALDALPGLLDDLVALSGLLDDLVALPVLLGGDARAKRLACLPHLSSPPPAAAGHGYPELVRVWLPIERRTHLRLFTCAPCPADSRKILLVFFFFFVIILFVEVILWEGMLCRLNWPGLLSL